MKFFSAHRRESILAALAVAAIFAVLLVLRERAPGGIAASGSIEVTQSDVASKVEGRLIQMLVRDGESVRKGQVLAVMERLDPTLKLEQARVLAAA